MKNNTQRTMTACFIGYIVQAIVNNFAPLLFVTFHNAYQIPMRQITLLITVNFSVQMLVDLLSAGLVKRIGYRVAILLAHGFSATGLVLLTILPDMLTNSFAGLLFSIICYAVGGGLLEVLVSPIMEACPTPHKAKAMSLLHSFYCWGHMGVVLLSTLFFKLFGMQHWKVLALLWAAIPLANMAVFAGAPISPLPADSAKGTPLRELLSNRLFWLFVLMMVCAGASEQAVSQWASAFAERGLQLEKSAGDLAGPMAFALLMGASRAFYGKYGERLRLERFMVGSGVLCLFAYLLIALAPSPVLSLVGCSICGLSVGILWPGVFSMASAAIPNGGIAMFAFLALAGDIGCAAGPTFAGLAAGMAHDDLRMGIFAAILFPCLLLYVLGRFLTRPQVIS